MKVEHYNPLSGGSVSRHYKVVWSEQLLCGRMELPVTEEVNLTESEVLCGG